MKIQKNRYTRTRIKWSGLCHTFGGWTLASHYICPGLIPGDFLYKWRNYEKFEYLN